MEFKDYGGDTGDGPKSNNYLKFVDGETKRLVLRGDIQEFYKKWVNGKGVECAPDEPGAGLRFKVNAIVDENGGLVAKVWEFGITIYTQLRDIHTEYPLPETKIKVTREGSTKDNTSYTVLPLLNAKDKLSEKQLEKIAAIDLHELSKKERPPVKNYAPGSDDSEIPF